MNGKESMSCRRVTAAPIDEALEIMLSMSSNVYVIRRHLAKSTSRPDGLKLIASPNVVFRCSSFWPIFIDSKDSKAVEFSMISSLLLSLSGPNLGVYW